MDQSIAGSIRISESDYPFSYEKETERITVYLGTKAITIPDDSEIVIGQKYGMMTGGKILYKLSVPYAIILSPEQGKYAFLWIKKKWRLYWAPTWITVNMRKHSTRIRSKPIKRILDSSYTFPPCRRTHSPKKIYKTTLLGCMIIMRCEV